MKKLSIAIIFLLNTIIFAQWENEGAWPENSFVGGTHGIAVDPDGKVWTASHFTHDKWIQEDSSVISTSAIYVFNEDGTPTDFSPIHFVETGNGNIDTLNGNCRGLEIDNEGNVLYVQSGPSKIIKINYLTGEGIASRLITQDIGTSPTSPAVSANGIIFVGPVVSAGTNPIAMYTSELEFLGSAIVGPPGISRTLEVSPDGNTLYWMAFDKLKMYVYQRPDIFSEFTIIDSSLENISIESSVWNDETGLLWVSNDVRGKDYKHLTWYGYDVTTKTMQDSFTWVPASNEAEYPRGIDFSPDGNIAYAGSFDVSTARVQKFVKTTVDGIDTDLVLENEFRLFQNYPNPFNPTTTIKYNLPENFNGLVNISLYNSLGQKISEIVSSHQNSGLKTVIFNASNFASGNYFYKITAGNFVETKKMTILK